MTADDTTGRRGSMMPLSLVVYAVVVLFGVGFTRVGSTLIAQAQAQNAADAAALAGAVDGAHAADDIAVRNGATVQSFDVIDRVVTVTVLKGGVTATAFAVPISVQ